MSYATPASAEPATLLGNNAAAVLGMITLGARSGYEIRRAAELSLRFFWALGPPQIYAELARLEEAGLVTGADATSGRPRPREFATTPAGRDALAGWLAEGGTAAIELRDPL